MHGGELVVDAVSHAYNNSYENTKPGLETYPDELHESTKTYMAEPYYMPKEKWIGDHTAEELERVLFLESDVDFTVHHSLPQFGIWKDGHASIEKGIALRDRNPGRVAIMGAVNPLSHDAVAEIEYLGEEVGVDGLKFYPTQYRDGESIRTELNHQFFGRQLLDKAVEVGITNVGVHKGLPVGGARSPLEPFNVHDVDEVAAEYPELTFEIVHAGQSFLEETRLTLARHPNVYANLEITSGLVFVHPEKFARVLGELLKWAGEEKIIFASGCTFAHPQPLIEAIWEFDYPESVAGEYPPLTDEVKRNILGRNAMRIFDVDPDDVRETATTDRWAEKRHSMDEKPEYWSSIGA